jgi:signal peptidase I
MTDAPPAESATFKKSVAREYLESIVVAVILALFIRTFVVQAFKIPTGSMETNLLIGDHLLVNKLVYSPSLGALEDTVLPKKEIERGHVIVFKFPEEPWRDFIKRVIGLPGEKIEIRDKVVYVNGKPLVYTAEKGYQDVPDLAAARAIAGEGPLESYTRFDSPPLRHDDPEYSYRVEDRRDTWGPEVVPEGRLFVMGDNRDNSRDSRYWSFLPRDQVKGRALLVYWSYEATRDEYHRTGIVNWIRDTVAAVGKTRWGRFFHLIR